MKTFKLLLMIIFSSFFAKMMIVSFNNFKAYGIFDALPYAFVGLVFLVIAGAIYENIKKGG